jgi:predicted metal-binding membrane protein
MSDTGFIERALRRQRLIVVVSLFVLVGLAWIYLFWGAGTGMSPLAMSSWQFPPRSSASLAWPSWNLTYAILVLAMWWVMMIAMMVPGAAPMILLYSRTRARASSRGQSLSSLGNTSLFVSGYLTVWFAFSVLATLAQYSLSALGILDGVRMWSTSAGLSAAILVLAGIYQLVPAKAACLEHCRSPVNYLAAHFRPGNLGAWMMGLEHGAYCLGCCWALMALLYVGGAMNLVWIAGLTILVLTEKLLARGRWLERTIGYLLIAAGLGVYAAA